MNTLLVAVRAVHYASTLLLFGELVFAVAVAGYGLPGRSAVALLEVGDGARRLLRVAGWSVVASIASGAAWLALAAASMSGRPVADALDPDTLGMVINATTFGNAWIVRASLAALLCALLLALAKSSHRRAASAIIAAMLVAAAAYLGALAWSGHAAAGDGFDGDVELLADVVHLLAAGAWLGALPGLVFLLRGELAIVDAVRATRRFSRLGAVCVSLLAASGAANAWYLVGDVPALLGTSYGRLLLAKLGLFAVILMLAVANRWYLAARLAQGEPAAPRLIRRNAIAEIAAGLGIVAIVGVLGITPPAVHETPVWPFAYTLSFERAEQSAWLQLAVAAAGMMACVAAGVALAGFRRRRWTESVAGVVGIVALAAIFVPLLAVPAYPSTYWSSPIRYTTDAIVRGSGLYASHCRDCHGLDRLDDAPAAGAPSTATANPVSHHSLRHREGEHFWWIARGIPQTTMPGFSSRLTESEIWYLIEFLHAQVEAQDAMAMTDRIKPLRSIVAPDFTFEFAGRPQETLRDQREKHVVLLVLYTLPQSLPRLTELALDAPAYAAAGAKVIALPAASPSASAQPLPADVRTFVANADASVATAYKMFARPASDVAETPAHVEFLIDRLGLLRVRWIGTAPVETRRTPAVLDRIGVLVREPLRPPSQWGHRHR